uniref:Isoaspartyl peptidase/L-asparaginase n=2 Tax=Eptatretus burgeri TaxID=7764 RepID=A0A8C4QBJ1_EPTBU
MVPMDGWMMGFGGMVAAFSLSLGNRRSDPRPSHNKVLRNALQLQFSLLPVIQVACANMIPVVLVHGGAGTIPEHRQALALAGVRASVEAAWQLLKSGGSVLDVVEHAVKMMEDDPVFNAGVGSSLNVAGEIQEDAMIMEGSMLNSGAVSCVKNIANPIHLARLVMEKSKHIYLSATGANMFARTMGIPAVPTAQLITEYRRLCWEKSLGEANSTVPDEGSKGTVGAIAIDKNGNVASATSTGGLNFKMIGRVGDVPCIGAGGYADNELGAVSTTGDGESIMKVTLARLVLFHMEQGKKPLEAAKLALQHLVRRTGDTAGLIALAPNGEWTAHCVSEHMSWAGATQGRRYHGLKRGEKHMQEVDE